MSCFFCESFFHESHNCDIYNSDESRRKIIISKNCCRKCLTGGYIEEFGKCKACEFAKKCFICFTRSHHTVYCRHRFDVSTFKLRLVPNIDKDLLPRYIQLLHLEEQYSLAFSLPNTFQFFNLKHLTVTDHNTSKNENSNYVITDKFKAKYFDPYYHKLSLNTIILKCKTIEIKKVECTSQEFLQLFFPQLIKFISCNVRVTSTVTFCDILQAAPNMEVIFFDQTNIKTDNSWPDDILKWKKGNCLKNLKIPIVGIDFNYKSFAKVIKEKSENVINISFDVLPIEPNETKNIKKIVIKFLKEMLPYFGLGKVNNHIYYNANDAKIKFNNTLNKSNKIKNQFRNILILPSYFYQPSRSRTEAAAQNRRQIDLQFYNLFSCNSVLDKQIH